MLYQLPNGKVIEISTEQFLEMSDEELEYLIAYNYGEVMEDPWFGSILNKRESVEPVVNDIEDITQTPEEEKLSDLDIDYNVDE